MNVRVSEWDQQYRAGERGAETAPTPLVIEFATSLPPGRALDLACGVGRDSIYLATRGWEVTSVDGSAAALEILERRAEAASVTIETVVADLQQHLYKIRADAWDLILDCYYLQRELFPAMKLGVHPGGVVLSIVHIPEPGEELTNTRAAPGELRKYFAGWKILHDYEGPSRDPAHKRPVAEIVTRRPHPW